MVCCAVDAHVRDACAGKILRLWEVREVNLEKAKGFRGVSLCLCVSMCAPVAQRLRRCPRGLRREPLEGVAMRCSSFHFGFPKPRDGEPVVRSIFPAVKCLDFQTQEHSSPPLLAAEAF